jgi:O-antigen/teichoic acid export membrane protein
MLTESYLGHAAQTFVTNGAIALVGVFTGVMSARLLGAVGRGELAAIQNWALFFAAIATIGIPEAIIYLGAKDLKRLSRLALSGLALLMISGAVAFVVGWIIMPRLLRAQPGDVVIGARAYLLMIFLYAASAIPVYMIRVLEKVTLWNAMRLVNPLIWLAIIVVAYFRNIRSPLTLALVMLAASIITTGVIILSAAYIVKPEWKVDIRMWRPMLAYGAPVLLSTMPQFLNSKLDQLLMTSLVAPEVLGKYVVAVSWSGALGPLSGAFASVLFPKISLAASPKEKKEILFKARNVSLAGSLAMVVPLLLITPYVVPMLYGQEFKSAVGPAMLLLIAAVFLGLNGVLEEGLKGMGRPNDVFLAEALGAALTMLMLLILLKPLGALGAAVASLVSYIATTAFLSMKLRKQTA